MHLWRSTGSDVGDVLRVNTDPASGLPTSEPELVYPRLAARSVRVSADGRRLVLLAGDRVANLREFTLDGTPDASDHPARSRTRGTGRWGIHDLFPDGTLLAGLEGDLGWELFAVSGDGTQRSLVRRKRAATGAAVSHDGRSIAIAIVQPAPAILIHDVVESRSRTIPVPEPLSHVAWSRDGKRITAMTTSSADHLLVVDVERGEVRTVTLQCGEKCEFGGRSSASDPSGRTRP